MHRAGAGGKRYRQKEEQGPRGKSVLSEFKEQQGGECGRSLVAGGGGAEHRQGLVIQGKVRTPEFLLFVPGSHQKVVSRRERIESLCISKGLLQQGDRLKATRNGISDQGGIS